VTEHLVFFVEGLSERDFLEGFLPKIMPPHITAHFQVFQGKQDLEKQLVRRMKYWLLPNTGFVVMRDQDSGDCEVIKTKLRSLCEAAGRADATVRIACRELETYFVGDWPAIAAAFDKPTVAALGNKAKYRNPDLLGSPSAEIKRHIAGFQKREGARRIAPHLDPAKNQSRSFRVLVQAIERLAAA
jgi:hypothetical protein